MFMSLKTFMIDSKQWQPHTEFDEVKCVGALINPITWYRGVTAQDKNKLWIGWTQLDPHQTDRNLTNN